MRPLRRALARLAATLRGHASADADLRAEMAAHLEMEIEANVRRGMTPGEARRRARIAAGGLTQAAERVREQRGLPWIEDAVADVRYAVRQLRRAPVATVTMVLVLSLGLGTNVVLLTVMSSLATLPPPGVARDEALVRIRGTLRAPGMAHPEARLLSWPEVQEVADAELFDGVAAYASERAMVLPPGATTPIAASVVYATANYFDLLGVRPALGRQPPAEPEVTRPATSPAAMISHAMWVRELGGDPDVIGRTLRVDDVPVEIVGVAPSRFVGTGGSGALTVWVPLAAYPVLQKRPTAPFVDSGDRFLNAVARLRPGVTVEAASSVVAGIAARSSRPHHEPTAKADAADSALVPPREETASADVVPLLTANARVRDRTDLLVSRTAAVGAALLVLLVTCTNVSALLAGLATARRREVGLRLSLGAPRRRVIRQLLTESVTLALAAAAVGLLVTALGIRLVGNRLEDLQLVVDWRVTLATCALALVTGVLFGLSPALHATRVSPGETLKRTSASVRGSRSRLQRALVVAQVAVTQPLLVGLGVVVMTMATDVGSRATSRVADQIAEIELDTWAGRVSATERAAGIAAAVERVAAMPGVTVAMPMEMGTTVVPLTVDPADRIAGVTPDGVMEARLAAAPEGYFDAFEIPIVRGRDFSARETAAASDDATVVLSFDVVIVGSDLAQRLWGDADPLGRHLPLALAEGSSGAAMEVVGVVDAAAAGPSQVDDQLRVYVPYAPLATGVVARTAGPALPMLGAMREAVAAAAPRMPIYRAETMAQREAELRRDLRRASTAVAAGGLLALLLSAIGLFAVVSFAVGQRTAEIGIRTALGARPDQVVRTFFLEGLATTTLGLALGLPLSLVAIWLVETRLSWPLSSSPLLGVAVAALVLVVASAAAWIPARRASALDPVVALRAE